MSLFTFLHKLYKNRLASEFIHSETIVGTKNEQTRFEWIVNILKTIHSGLRILDAGAGEGRYKPYCSHLQYVSQDFAQYNGQGDQRGLQTGTWNQSNLAIVSDITSIPEPDQSFDAILCIEVLEHLPDPLQALRELTRLLKPEGKIILTAPFCSLTHFAPHFYQTGYSRYFYEYWLESLGYKIEEMLTNGNYFEYLAQELRRLQEIGKRYGGLNKFSSKVKTSIESIMCHLQQLSDQDNGSDELLCFGYHILATKLPN